MTARPLPAGARGSGQSLTATLFATLLAATLVELLLLRSATRVAIHIPGIEEVAGPYRFVSGAGEYGYYVSAVAVIAWLGIAAAALWRRAEPTAIAGALAVAGFLVIAGAGRAAILPGGAVDLATICSVVLLAGIVAGRGSWVHAGSFLAFGVAFAATASATILTGVSGASGLLTLGEAAALVFAALLPFAVGLRLTRGLVATWVVSAIVLFGAFAGASGSSVRILMLWNEGLTGAFAPAWYALAGGALVATIVGLLRAGRRSDCAAILLLIAGGIGLHSTHQSALVLAGLIAMPAAAAARPSAAVAEASTASTPFPQLRPRQDRASAPGRQSA